MYGFQDAAMHLRCVMQKQLNCMDERALQYLLERSFDLIEELKEYRHRLSLALYNRLSETIKK